MVISRSYLTGSSFRRGMLGSSLRRPMLGNGFSPRQFAGLQLWLAASSLTATLGDGDPVATWLDQSGNMNRATQGTSSLRPTYFDNQINGWPALSWDGVDDSMTLATFITIGGATPSTIFSVVKRRTLGVPIMNIGGSSGLFTCVSNATANMAWVDSAATIATNAYSGTASPITCVWQEGPNSADYLTRQNGTQVITPATSLASSTFSTVGSRAQTSNPVSADGLIAELLVYNTLLTGTQIAMVEGYLRAKYATF